MSNEDEFESAVSLYVKATENDWRSVQAATEKSAANEATVSKPAAQETAIKGAAEEKPAEAAADTNAASAVETSKLMNVARSILVNENGSIE